MLSLTSSKNKIQDKIIHKGINTENSSYWVCCTILGLSCNIYTTQSVYYVLLSFILYVMELLIGWFSDWVVTLKAAEIQSPYKTFWSSSLYHNGEVKIKPSINGKRRWTRNWEFEGHFFVCAEWKRPPLSDVMKT